MKATYIRRRIVVAMIVIICVFALAKCANEAMSYGCNTNSVVVEHGDTLWSIAERHCSGNPADVVNAVININNGGRIRPGDVVLLP